LQFPWSDRAKTDKVHATIDTILKTVDETKQILEEQLDLAEKRSRSLDSLLDPDEP
jgi:hypothetical protein